VAFPAHMAPMSLLFYKGNQFPEKYQQGAFIAFHGSWNRAPLPQEGYFVAFVPFKMVSHLVIGKFLQMDLQVQIL